MSQVWTIETSVNPDLPERRKRNITDADLKQQIVKVARVDIDLSRTKVKEDLLQFIPGGGLYRGYWQATAEDYEVMCRRYSSITHILENAGGGYPSGRPARMIEAWIFNFDTDLHPQPYTAWWDFRTSTIRWNPWNQLSKKTIWTPELQQKLRNTWHIQAYVDDDPNPTLPEWVFIPNI